jgi:hypothetical protein
MVSKKSIVNMGMDFPKIVAAFRKDKKGKTDHKRDSRRIDFKKSSACWRMETGWSSFLKTIRL